MNNRIVPTRARKIKLSGTNPEPTAERMSRAERNDLAHVVRREARIACQDADDQVPKQMAVVEAQLTATYAKDNANWKELTQDATEYINGVAAKIAKRCTELGIPESFQPSFGTYWISRGENGIKERRAELRRAAQLRLEANARAAKAIIRRKEADLLTELVSNGIESSAAKDFLQRLPTAEQLMPQLELGDLKNQQLLLRSAEIDVD